MCACSSRTRGDRAREWGWKPQRTVEDWDKSFTEEMEAIIQEGHERATAGNDAKPQQNWERYASR